MAEKQIANLRMIAWELTRRCNLSCAHCRASATNVRHPDELTTQECFEVLDEIAGFARPEGHGLPSSRQSQKPVIILTGGEPLLREDVFEIAAYGKKLGLTLVMAPNGLLLTDENIQKIIKSGIKRISVSLDGPNTQVHDSLRQVEGAFAGAIEGIRRAKNAGLEFQINSTITKRNIKFLPEIMKLAQNLGAAGHHIFLLVPIGRGKEMADEGLTAGEYEEVLRLLRPVESSQSNLLRCKGARNDGVTIKVTCAPHFNRVLAQENPEIVSSLCGRGCMGGVSFCFISHIGDLQPCGYLEIPCGNARKGGFMKNWLESDVFNNLRDYSKYKGKCGICEFKTVCGGCRARAYAKFGDYLREEPYCSYIPNNIKSDSH